MSENKIYVGGLRTESVCQEYHTLYQNTTHPFENLEGLFAIITFKITDDLVYDTMSI